MSTPLLERGYAECARITRRFGTTYWWGAILLEPQQRREVHAVYTLCRLADDIVDAEGATGGGRVEQTGAALAGFRQRFVDAVEVARSGGQVLDPVLAAIGDTVARTGIEDECFERFFDAMAMDLHTTGYADFEALCGYMEGSAAVIGEMMLPVLRPTSPAATEPARNLGFAFQLTNFLRDVGEDLDRGRIYLPMDTLEQFGADPWLRRVTPAWREAMKFEIARNRGLYRMADAGIPHLPDASARCVRTARVLYSRILDRIEAADYDVFSARVRVPRRQKLAIAVRHARPGAAA